MKCVGSTRRIENLKEARTALEVDVNGCIVIPGFIDPGLSATSERTTSRRRGPKKSREIFEENLELMRSCLQHGTLTVGVKADEPGGFPAAVPLLKQLARIGDSPVGMMRTWKVPRTPRFPEEMRDFLATLDVIRRRKLAHFIEISAVERSSPFASAMLTALKQSRLPLTLLCNKGEDGETLALISALQPASVRCSTWIGEAEAKMTAALARLVMFSPGNDIAEACGFGMRHVIDHGGAIALTSGYDARSAPGFSMQTAIARAVALGRISIEEAISAATVNAAYALGQGSKTGTIEAGKRADIAVLGIPDYHELPRQFGINQVRMVIRDGQVVFNRGRWKIEAHAHERANATERVPPERLNGRVRPEHFRRERSQAG